MILKPHIVFATAKDTVSTDFYLFELRKSLIPYWRQAYFDAGANFDKSRMVASLNTIIITTFVSPAPAYYYKSTDRGLSWSTFAVPYTFYAFYPLTDTTIYACTLTKLYVTYTGGSPWTELGDFSAVSPFNVPIEIHIFPEPPLTRIVIIKDGGETIHTTDNGSSFIRHDTNLASIVKTIVYPDRIVAFSSDESEISLDNCVTWATKITTISGKIFQDATLSLRKRDEVIAVCDDTVIVTYDGGLSWNQGASEQSGAIIHSVAYDEDYNFFGCSQTYGYFYKIRNYGEVIDPYQFNSDTNIKPFTLHDLYPVFGTIYDSHINNTINASSEINTQSYSQSLIRGTVYE